MFFTNLADKQIITDSLCKTSLVDFQVVNSQLSGMIFSENSWNQGNVNNCNINDSGFHNFTLDEVRFIHTSLINSQFIGCKGCNFSFSGNTLIKTLWANCRFMGFKIFQCTMQRARIEKTIFNESFFIDFEGIYANISNTVFYNCHFEINYGNGMNGFSGALFENCLFINCTFSGFPLRGSKTIYCSFVGCTGEITDDMECNSTFSDTIELVRFCNPINEMKLSYRHESEMLISEIS